MPEVVVQAEGLAPIRGVVHVLVLLPHNGLPAVAVACNGVPPAGPPDVLQVAAPPDRPPPVRPVATPTEAMGIRQVATPRLREGRDVLVDSGAGEDVVPPQAGTAPVVDATVVTAVAVGVETPPVAVGPQVVPVAVAVAIEVDDIVVPGRAPMGAAACTAAVLETALLGQAGETQEGVLAPSPAVPVFPGRAPRPPVIRGDAAEMGPILVETGEVVAHVLDPPILAEAAVPIRSPTRDDDGETSGGATVFETHVGTRLVRLHGLLIRLPPGVGAPRQATVPVGLHATLEEVGASLPRQDEATRPTLAGTVAVPRLPRPAPRP